ncbi:MAG: clumping factor [Frankiales bacterium]|nr:clumping factor [Frankiales bacterium]
MSSLDERRPDEGLTIWEEVQRSADFQELRRRLRRFAFPMTAAFLAWYMLYVILSAYARGFMSHKLLGNINVAYVFGLLQFVSTFAIAWLYARYATTQLDPLADRLRARVEGEAP